VADKYDIVVVGSGPGGYVAAIRAAQLGMKTAVVEREFIGGRCLNIACIPAKAMLRAADVLGELRDGSEFGVNAGDVSFDMGAAGKHRDKVVKTLTGGVGGLLKKHKVDVLEGTARLTGSRKFAVDGTDYEAGKIVLATGSVEMPLPGTEFGGRVVDTAGAWLMNERPARLAVVGAGASGTEIASAFGRFGTEVVLIEMLDQVLPAEDVEIAKVVQSELRKQNVKVVTGEAVEGVKAGRDSVEIKYGGETGKFDYLCIAAGRATHPLSYDDIPAATFCLPQVASFGLTEAEAIARGEFEVVVGRFPMGGVGAATVYGDRKGMVKLVGDRKYGELLGAHVVGVRATEMIAELVVAKQLEGGYEEVAYTVHPHPTFSEAVMEAARATDGWVIHA